MPTPSRRAQLAPPGNSAHHPRGRTSTPACGVSITPTPYSTTTPTVRAYPDTPPRTPPQPPEPPTNTHPAETGHGPHQQPLQARKTCATRTPPPGAAGAHLSALQPTPRPSPRARTADKPSAARTRTHSHTAATITTNRHSASHHDTPKPATTTKTTKHQHKRTRAQPQQRDQHTTL